MSHRLVVLASGEGSNFQALVEASLQGELQAEIVGLICNKPRAGVLARAQTLEVPFRVIPKSRYKDLDEWNLALVDQLKSWRADWVVLAGFTALLGPQVIDAYSSRIVNTHPSLLPKYGGAGMYGQFVHQAVIEAKEVETGITVHLVNDKFDEGPVLAQTRVPVQPQDTVETLSQRLKEVERSFYPKVLQDLVTGRIKAR